MFRAGRPGGFTWDLGDYALKRFMEKIARRSEASGSWEFADTQRISFATGQAIAAAPTPLENNAGLRRTDQAPSHIDPDVFYDAEYGELFFRNAGDVYLMTIDFDFRDAEASPSWMEFYLTDGSSARYQHSITIPRGQNANDHVNHSFAIRVLPSDTTKTFTPAILTPDNLTIWNISYEFVLLHRGW